MQRIGDEEYSASENLDPFSYWSCRAEIDLDGVDLLRKIALFGFSAPASSADLERIWSSCLINMTSRCRRLKKENMLKTIQIKTDITTEHKYVKELAQATLSKKNTEKAIIINLLDEIEEVGAQSQQSQNTLPASKDVLCRSSFSEREIDEETEGNEKN